MGDKPTVRGIVDSPVLDADPDGATVKAVINGVWDEPGWCLERVALAAFKAGKDDRTLRDWFAGQFLAGAVADNSPLGVPADASQSVIDDALRQYWGRTANAAYVAADAMLAARKSGQPS